MKYAVLLLVAAAAVACEPRTELPPPDELEAVDTPLAPPDTGEVGAFLDDMRVDEGGARIRVIAVEGQRGVSILGDGTIRIGVGERFDMNLLCIKRRAAGTDDWIPFAGTCNGVRMQRRVSGA